jgi:predicted DNA-binding transcriptional regulator AlpA
MSLSRDETTLPRLLNKKQVLALVPVTFTTLWSWIRQGKFPAARTVGSKPMWIEAEVVEWITTRPTRIYLTRPTKHSQENSYE